MKKSIPFFTIVSIATFAFLSFNFNQNLSHQSAYSSAPDFSSNPPTGKTGAPTESTCTDCHQGSVQSAEGVVDFIFDGADSTYVPGQTYNLEIDVTSGPKNGFELTILDASNQKAGDFVNGTNTSSTLAVGREYIRHSASSGITNWQFQWTAPTTDAGDLRAYYAVNKSNNGGTTGGDVIYVGSDVIYSEASIASVSAIDENPFQINTIWNSAAQQIHLDYNIEAGSRIYVTVQTINGQKIQSTDLGVQSPGQYHQKLAVESFVPGVYIVSVFVNNAVFNKKLMLN